MHFTTAFTTFLASSLVTALPTADPNTKVAGALQAPELDVVPEPRGLEKRQMYLSSLNVVYDCFESGLIQATAGGSTNNLGTFSSSGVSYCADGNANLDFGGYTTFIQPAWQSAPDGAAVDVTCWHQGSANGDFQDLAKGAGGDYRYCATDRIWGSGTAQRVIDVGLWRTSSQASGVPAGWSGMTADINQGRGGDYLYVLWKVTSQAV